MRPDFKAMTIAELQTYLLSHRHDQEAFYELVDRLEANSQSSQLYPVPDTPENIAIMEAEIRKRIQNVEGN